MDVTLQTKPIITLLATTTLKFSRAIWVEVSKSAIASNVARVSKRAGDQEIIFVRDPAGQVLAEYDGTTGALIAEYVYLNGQRIARIAADGSTTYFHNDHLGTPRAITDATGQVVWEGETLPFGTEYTSTGSRADHYTFTGHEWDAGLDLHYMHARYYSPEIGRFITVDPVGAVPDLSVTSQDISVSPSPVQNQPCTVTVRVYNLGTGSVSGFDIELYEGSGMGGTLIGSQTRTGMLAPGAFALHAFPWVPVTAGPAELFAVVDATMSTYERRLTADVRKLSRSSQRMFLDVFDRLAELGYGDMTNQRFSDVVGGALFTHFIPLIMLGAVMSVVTFIRHRKQIRTPPGRLNNAHATR